MCMLCGRDECDGPREMLELIRLLFHHSEQEGVYECDGCEEIHTHPAAMGRNGSDGPGYLCADCARCFLDEIAAHEAEQRMLEDIPTDRESAEALGIVWN